jgi:hypothetical protein
LFILALILMASLTLYNPAASRNEKTYVVFIVMVSLLYSMRGVALAARLLFERLYPDLTVKPPYSSGSAVIAVIAIAAVAMLPPLLLFRAQHIVWAVRFCGWLMLGAAFLVVTLSAVFVAFGKTKYHIDRVAARLVWSAVRVMSSHISFFAYRSR